MTRSSTWLVVGSHLDPKYGGISGMLPSFCAAVKKPGECALSLLSVCQEEEGQAFRRDSATEFATLPPGRMRWFEQDWRERVRALTDSADGVHIHGLWEEHCMAAAWAARAGRTPYVISAHGMLEPWALNHKRFKKLLYSLFIERRNLSGAARLHALNAAEAEHYRSFGARNPIAIVPNGVEIPENVSASCFREAFPALDGKRLVLFLGRVHPKKGLDILVESWAAAARAYAEAHLVIAGPDCEGSVATLSRAIEQHGIGDRVSFVGMLDHRMKWSALAAAELFVLPSYSEGLSISVLEAMGMGLPVLITRQCNMPEVAARECGWVIEPEAAALEGALHNALGQDAAALRQVGANGRKLVQDRFNWDVVGKQMRAVYDWALGGAVPGNVEVRA